MTFSIWDYAVYSAVIPILVATVSLIIAVYFTRKLCSKRVKLIISLIPIMLSTVLIFSGMVLYAEGWPYPLTPILESNAPVHITIGEVTNISTAPSPPKYYNSVTHSFEPAKFIEVNGVNYYALSADVQEGDLVKIEWTTVEHVVLSYELMTPEEYASCVVPPYPTTEEAFHAPPKVITPKAVRFGTILRNVCLSIFVVLVFAQYQFGSKIAEFLEEKDSKVYGEIKPNRFGLFYFSISTLSFYGMIVGVILTGFHTAIPIAILAVIGHFIIIMKKQTTKIEVIGDELVYKCLLTKRTYRKSDISSICWGRSQIPNNRQLNITFQAHRSIHLEQEWFLGLENMYNYIVGMQSS